MNQQDILLRQNQAEPFTFEEMDGNLNELDLRTKHNVSGYNSIAELAAKVIALELASGGAGDDNDNHDFDIIYFGAGAIPNSTGGNTSAAVLVAHINGIGFTVVADVTPILNITVLRTLNGNQYWVKEQYLFKNSGILGTWGTGSTNGAISSNQLIYLNGVTLQNVTGNESFTDLGDIGASNVENAVNALDPVMNLYVGTDYYFTCVRNGNQETYLYTGSLPTTVGTGETATESTDFDLQNWSGATGTIALDPAAVKTAYESNDDTNAFTDDEKAKLAALNRSYDFAVNSEADDLTVDLAVPIYTDILREPFTGWNNTRVTGAAPDGDILEFEIYINGVLKDTVSIDSGETDSNTAVTPSAVVGGPIDLVAGDKIEVFCSNIGSTTAGGAYAKMSLQHI